MDDVKTVENGYDIDVSGSDFYDTIFYA